MIQTDRLDIRFSVLEDLDDIYEYVSNKEVMIYEREDYPTKEGFEKVLTFLVERNLMYSVRLKGKQKVIGHVYLGKTNPAVNNEYNLGYIFNPLYHRKGYCTEASRAIVDYGFGVLKANRIRAGCNPMNTPSWKVMEKIGLKKEGYFKKRFFVQNDENGHPFYTDEVTYGLHISDWKKSEK